MFVILELVLAVLNYILIYRLWNDLFVLSTGILVILWVVIYALTTAIPETLLNYQIIDILNKKKGQLRIHFSLKSFMLLTIYGLWPYLGKQRVGIIIFIISLLNIMAVFVGYRITKYVGKFKIKEWYESIKDKALELSNYEKPKIVKVKWYVFWICVLIGAFANEGLFERIIINIIALSFLFYVVYYKIHLELVRYQNINKKQLYKFEYCIVALVALCSILNLLGFNNITSCLFAGDIYMIINNTLHFELNSLFKYELFVKLL